MKTNINKSPKLNGLFSFEICELNINNNIIND